MVMLLVVLLFLVLLVVLLVVVVLLAVVLVVVLLGVFLCNSRCYFLYFISVSDEKLLLFYAKVSLLVSPGELSSS